MEAIHTAGQHDRRNKVTDGYTVLRNTYNGTALLCIGTGKRVRAKGGSYSCYSSDKGIRRTGSERGHRPKNFSTQPIES